MPTSRRMFVLLSTLLLCALAACGSSDRHDAIVGRMEQYLKGMEDIGFSAAVLVEMDGEVVLSRGYGMSDRAKNLRITQSTIFDIGSITKQFTAAAILKLEMEGKLSLRDPLSKYFPGVAADKAGITIHDLLRHQSGLPSNVGRDYEPVTQAEFITRVFDTPLRFETGTGFGYSNIGYSLLAMIVEKVSGQFYEQYLYENLWKPAGMEVTGYTRPDFDPAYIAVVYSRDDSVWGKPTEKQWDRTAPYWHLTGNGGILSTTMDLYAWHRALLDDDILSKEAKHKLHHPELRPDEKEDGYYAYGWDVSKTHRGTRLVSHNGANGFYYAEIRRFIDEGAAIIVLENKSHPDFDVVCRELSRIMFEPKYTPDIPPPDTKASREFSDHMVQVFIEKDPPEVFAEYERRPRGVELLDYHVRDEGFRRLFETNEPSYAVRILEYNAAMHRRSAPAQRDLAEAYMETGRSELAILHFKKSLKLDPHSRFARDMIAKLEAEK